MAMNNSDLVSKALDLLNRGVRPFFEKQMKAAHGDCWLDEVRRVLRPDVSLPLDTQALLKVIRAQWHVVFYKTLGTAERNLVFELQEVRNRWAHQKSFTREDTYRALDSVQRLLTSLPANDEAEQLRRLKEEVLGPVVPPVVPVDTLPPEKKPRATTVKTWEEIRQNILRLEEYHCSTDRHEVECYKAMIKRGRCFVVYKRADELLFGPSRFAGYANNDLPTRQTNDLKDGKETNPAISKIVGQPAMKNNHLEEEYLRLCAKISVTPNSVGRKYWLMS